MSKLLQRVRKMKIEELLESIEDIDKSWRVQENNKDTLILTKSIILEKRLEHSKIKAKRRSKTMLFKDGSARGMKCIAIRMCYKEVRRKLIKLCTDVPTETGFKRLYPLIVELAQELHDEEELLTEIFLSNQKYKEIKSGASVINQINTSTLGESLFMGCKMYLLYKTNNKKLISERFKNRTSPKLLMNVATAKHQEFNVTQARAYVNYLSPTRYNLRSIKSLYLKL